MLVGEVGGVGRVEVFEGGFEALGGLVALSSVRGGKKFMVLV